MMGGTRTENRVHETPSRPPSQNPIRTPCEAVMGDFDVRPPVGNTGVHLTVHWLRGGMFEPLDDVLERVQAVTGGGYAESHDWGRNFYRRHHEFVAGLRVYFDPSQDNMPPVMVDAPGAACELVGLEGLRLLFCNSDLSRVDLAWDGVAFTPREAAGWVRDGNVRCKSKRRKFIEDLGEGDGETLELGSRASERFLRVYDRRGPTRVELELKGEHARGAMSVLLAELEELPELALGVLRDFVDFVDASQDANVSRAPLLPSWESFVGAVDRIRLVVRGRVVPTIERVLEWVERQVAPTLAVYDRLGYSVPELLRLGRSRWRHRHRSMLHFAGVYTWGARAVSPGLTG